jgi:hypothetical protein
MKFINDKNWGALLLCPIWGVFHGYYWSISSVLFPALLALALISFQIAVMLGDNWVATIFIVIGSLFFSIILPVSIGCDLLSEVSSTSSDGYIQIETCPGLLSLLLYFIIGFILFYIDSTKLSNTKQLQNMQIVSTRRRKWNAASLILFIPIMIFLCKFTIYSADLAGDLANKLMGV